MKIKKIIYTLALILCLGVSTIILTACGGNKVTSLFGKTLSFSGFADISQYTYTVENKDMKLDTLVKKYFDKIDWQTTLGKSKEEVKDADNAIKLMSDYIYKDVNESALRTVKFEFSNKEESKVAIDNKEYNVNAISLYEYRFTTGNGEEEITIRYESGNTFFYQSNALNDSALPVSETNSVSISFLQPTEIRDGIVGSISVSGRVLYKA